MTEKTDPKNPTGTEEGQKKTLTLSKKLELKKVPEKDQVRQSFSHGRSKTVEVEVKRKRIPLGEKAADKPVSDQQAVFGEPSDSATLKRLTHGELETRFKAVQEALRTNVTEQELQPSLLEQVEEEEKAETVEEVQSKEQDSPFPEESKSSAPKPSEKQKSAPVKTQEVKKKPHEQVTPIILRASSYGPSKTSLTKPTIPAEMPIEDLPQKSHHAQSPKHEKHVDVDLEDEGAAQRKAVRGGAETKKLLGAVRKTVEAPRKLHRNILTKVLDNDGGEERTRSIAAMKRARQKHKMQGHDQEQQKIIREVTIPETISVGELANRMAVRGADVIKALMKLGTMVTINQMIDADTAELLCTEFGHKFKRVADSDIELGLGGDADAAEDMYPRAPVVTVMGHVDHGKTSLLDALRQTDIVSGEAGGITQHIGAYQVTMKSGQKITFIDTPGHAAFSEMRARGANVTDIVVLVVAADDGIMEQTLEAINHATAAKVPMVVAINKMDKPEANPDKVRNELLQHGIVLEEYGGEVMSVEVSAKQRLNLEKLEETILLQAEVLDLKANPNRTASGVVVEAKMDKGRGTVATVLIQRGTLRVGDLFVAGTEWGRVRALVNDHGQPIKEVTPAMPVEVLGFNGMPSAGDEFFVVENENKAREITAYRQHRKRENVAVASARGSMEQMMSKIAAGEARELPLVIKTDVQGSLEAISSSLSKFATAEVTARVLHGAVGGINESDVTLARASGGIIIGFNVRANPQAREMAKRDGVEIRYYSIIYDVLDDMKAIMGGMLAPTVREKYLGTAEIRDVFNITRVGKIAGCYVTEGVVKRGSKVRLLRDNVVIHEGDLKTLKRFKDEVKEVKESYECGMAFENYHDIRVGDMIECFELESIARQL
ncbi:MAG: translation initiation factor IF-2 [Alphaproteobacteria bacterium]|nr:translation initiation factor IF-2 [Alphaproteobacteria bacterium]